MARKIASSLFVFLTFFILSPVTLQSTCESHEFQCIDDGRCIHENWVCDGEEDCFDSSDESQNCTRTASASNDFEAPATTKKKEDCEFKCRNDQCVPLSRRCDMIYDCFDQSDEMGCANESDSNNRRINLFNQSTEHALLPQEIPSASDFLESTVDLLNASKRGEQIPTDQLNRSSQGLDQYYLSKAYSYFFATVKPVNESYVDPVCMPNATSGNIEFYRVKVFGFPGFKENATIRHVIDKSPYVKNYTMHFNATSDVTIISGFFAMLNKSYYFVYRANNNAYTARVDKIRARNSLLKPKSTTESFDTHEENFVHTCDRTEKRHAEVNATVLPTLRKVLREIYMPRLAESVQGVLRPNSWDADADFAEEYRSKLREALLASAAEHLRRTGHVRHQFSPQMTKPEKAGVDTYTAAMEGYVNYTGYDFNSTESEANGTILFMYDTVRLHYPEDVCNLVIAVADRVNGKHTLTHKIRSIDITIAYKATLSTTPFHVFRNREKWRPARTGFSSNFTFYKEFNPFFNFLLDHVQVELAKLLGAGLPP